MELTGKVMAKRYGFMVPLTRYFYVREGQCVGCQTLNNRLTPNKHYGWELMEDNDDIDTDIDNILIGNFVDVLATDELGWLVRYRFVKLSDDVFFCIKAVQLKGTYPFKKVEEHIVANEFKRLVDGFGTGCLVREFDFYRKG